MRMTIFLDTRRQKGKKKKTKKSKIKRCYFITGYDDEAGFSVIESSVKEAKRKHAHLIEYDDWRDIRVKWMRNVYVDDLPLGTVLDDDVGLIEGLRRGAYAWVEGVTCPICQTPDETLYCMITKTADSEGVVCCNNCREKEDEKENERRRTVKNK